MFILSSWYDIVCITSKFHENTKPNLDAIHS